MFAKGSSYPKLAINREIVNMPTEETFFVFFIHIFDTDDDVIFDINTIYLLIALLLINKNIF